LENHWSKYGHSKCSKHNHNNNDKKSKTWEEVHAIEDPDFKDHIQKILKELLPWNSKKNNKKQRNNILNIEELHLSNDNTNSEDEGEE